MGVASTMYGGELAGGGCATKSATTADTAGPVGVFSPGELSPISVSIALRLDSARLTFCSAGHVEPLVNKVAPKVRLRLQLRDDAGRRIGERAAHGGVARRGAERARHRAALIDDQRDRRRDGGRREVDVGARGVGAGLLRDGRVRLVIAGVGRGLVQRRCARREHEQGQLGEAHRADQEQAPGRPRVRRASSCRALRAGDRRPQGLGTTELRERTVPSPSPSPSPKKRNVSGLSPTRARARHRRYSVGAETGSTRKAIL